MDTKLLCPWDSPWVAISSSRGSSQLWDGTYFSYVFCIGRQDLYNSNFLKWLPSSSFMCQNISATSFKVILSSVFAIINKQSLKCSDKLQIKNYTSQSIKRMIWERIKTLIWVLLFSCVLPSKIIRRLLRNVFQAYGGCTEPFGRDVNKELKNIILVCINLPVLLTPYQKNEVIQWENIYKAKWLSSGRPRKYYQLTIFLALFSYLLCQRNAYT